MKRLILALLLSIPLLAFGQDRSPELDKAVEEARAAYLALKEAERRRDQGVESLPGERLGTVGGSTAGTGGSGTGGGTVGGGSVANKPGRRARQSDEYFERQARLEQDVELARKRYEAAVKRWNDLK